MTRDIQLIRRKSTHGEVLIVLTADYSLTVEITVRGELDATTIEKLLHAPAAMLAQRDRL